MVKCPACGAGMRFDPASQMVKCDHCETKLEPETFSNSDAIMASQDTIFESTLYTCPQCGGEIVSDDDTVATFCSYCGASVMLEGRSVQMMAPSYVLPYRVTKEQCQVIYKNMINKAYFAPAYMKSDAQIQKIRGIYMPYWNYDLSKSGTVSFPAEKSYRRGDYIYTDHYGCTVDVSANYTGVSFDASSSFADELSGAISPFNYRENKGFLTAYMSGFYADIADVGADVYETEAHKTVAGDIGNEISKLPQLKGLTTHVNEGDVSLGLATKKKSVSYYPVWFLANRKGEYVSYAVINGQSGKAAADIPIDYKKYLIGSLLVSIPIILILDLLFTLTPGFIMLATALFSIISWIISDQQMNLLYTRNYYLNDKGLQSVQGMDRELAAKVAEQTIKKEPKKTSTAKGSTFLFLFVVTMMFIIALGAGMVGDLDAEAVQFMFMFGYFSLFIIAAISNSVKSKKPVSVSNKVIYKKPFKEKLNVLIKPIISLVFSIVVLLVNPVMDIWYYSATFVSMILVLISFADLIKLHNKLTMRLPRQFGKRGGDENEGV